jgi:hypothetical protein
MVNANEYCLLVYRGDQEGKLQYTRKVWFVVRPTVKFLRLEDDLEENGKVQRELAEETDKEVTIAIRNWIFKKTNSPFRNKSGLVWSMEPRQFSAEDKEHIQRLYLFEEL